MTDQDCAEPLQSRSTCVTPAVALCIETDRYRKALRSAIPDTLGAVEIESARTIPDEAFDLAIVEEGLLPTTSQSGGYGTGVWRTPILYVTTDDASTPETARSVITDVIHPSAHEGILKNRIWNTIDDNGQCDKRQYGMVGIDCVPSPALSVDVVDGDRFVRHANSAFETEFGFESEEIVDGSLEELLVPDTAAEYTADLVERALAGETIERVLRRDTRHGRRDYLVRMIESRQCEADLWITYTDVTGKRCREQQVRVLNRVLRHNLRNDMNIILGNVEGLLADTDDPQAATAAAEIKQAAKSLVELGDTAGALRETWDESEPTAVDLVRVARRIQQEVRQETPSVNIGIQSPERCWANGDSRLVTAISELVENAIEHTPEGTAIDLRIEPGEEWARLSVIDDGPGLPASERAVLSGASETPLEHGSGLGLWIVNWIVSISGGQLDVDTGERCRTTVTVSLPAADVDPN